jgi:hypothetical protein
MEVVDGILSHKGHVSKTAIVPLNWCIRVFVSQERLWNAAVLASIRAPALDLKDWGNEPVTSSLLSNSSRGR